MTVATAALPAIAGGTPIKTTPYVKAERYGADELNELREALAQQTLFYSQGQKVFELEKQFAAKHGAKFAIACTSGTAGIHSAVIGAGISPDDEVIMPPITDLGTALPVLWQGAVPIFADLDPLTANLLPSAVEEAITPKTRAIIAVHLAGNPCDLRAMKAIADKHNLILIEDCAQAHGTMYDGKPVGTLGHFGCYSLNEFKHIGCGDGGIILTDDEQVAKKLRLATDKAYNRKAAVGFVPIFLANNYRMTELQGAVALAQLRKCDSIVRRRQIWCERLTARLRGLPGLQLPTVTAHGTHSYWFYLVRIDQAVLGVSSDEFTAAMKAEGVPIQAHYIGQPLYKAPLLSQHSAFERGHHAYRRVDYANMSCPTAQAILDSCGILAINEGYTDADLDDTVRTFERVVGWFHSKR
jgi:perosamine synthetase